MLPRRSPSILLSLALGCGPSIELPEDGAGSTGAPSDPVPPITTPPPPPPPGTSTTGTDPTTTEPDLGDDSTGSQFIDPDTTCAPSGDQTWRCTECDLFGQDCPEDEKCMPWANDGGTHWNALRCTPIADDPGQAGEPCTVTGSNVSGFDDCDQGLMCWDVDAETLEGRCAEICRGSPSRPVCRPATSCLLASDGAIALCLPECDPLGDDCEPAQACIPSESGFVCTPVSSGAAAGQRCERFDACAPGLVCVSAEAVGSCEPGVADCCTPWCDLSAPDPSAGCAHPGQECVSWWEGAPVPSFEALGVCAAPP